MFRKTNRHSHDAGLSAGVTGVQRYAEHVFAGISDVGCLFDCAVFDFNNPVGELGADAFSWVTTRTAPLRRFAMSDKRPMMVWPLGPSSAAVGSSARIAEGSATMARAIATLCCSPPLMERRAEPVRPLAISHAAHHSNKKHVSPTLCKAGQRRNPQRIDGTFYDDNQASPMYQGGA
jgi:hypothetical protein